MAKKLNLKKGEWYICHNTIFIVEGNVIHIVQFTVGKKYYCHRDGYLKNDNGNEMTFFHDAAEYFKPSDRMDVMDEIKNNNNTQNMNDNYNPFKAAVEAIMEMCEKYGSFETISEDSRVRANDFLNNVRVKCKDAFEYDKMFPTTTQLKKLVKTSYEDNYKQCKEDMTKGYV